MSTSTSTSTDTDTDTLAPPSPQEEEQTLIPDLANDISQNILARIPRTHHPNLLLVSRAFLSFLTSPLYYRTRTRLNFTQPYLYISLRIPTSPTLHWFTLYQSPNPFKNEQKRPNFLVSVPPTPEPLVGAAFVPVGYRIFVIGGSINDVPSSQVWVLDCRFNRWERARSMRVSREFPAAGVVDGKVYVIGGCVVDNFARDKNWAEVYDPVTGMWQPVESSGGGGGGVMVVREKWMHASAVIDGKVFAMADRDGVVYDPRKKEWGFVEKRLNLGWRGRACVVDRVLYCYDYLGKIRGFDVVDKVWKELRGVEKELPKFLCGATMANFGDRLVVVWERKEGKEVHIWCAVISVEKRRNEGECAELWGKVVWCDVVHRVSVGSAIINCLAVSL